MRYFIMIACCLFYVPLSFATAQVPDILICQDQKFPLFTNPLETLFKEKPDQRPELSPSSSANWRGYVATFVIANQQFKLYDFGSEKYIQDGPNRGFQFEPTFATTFPDPTTHHLTSYSGILVIPQGDLTQYVHQAYASSYERYLLIRIQRGIVMESAEMTAAEFNQYKTRQLEAYKQTADYQQQLQQLSNSPHIRDDADLDQIMLAFAFFVEKTVIPFSTDDKTFARTICSPTNDASL